MPIIAAILILALLYWLWPYILALAVAATIYFTYKSERKRKIDDATKKSTDQNIIKATESIPAIKSKYVGLYGMQQSDQIRIIQIKDIKIEERLGKKCLSIEICRVRPENETKGTYYHPGSNMLFKSDQLITKMLEIDGDTTEDKYSADWVLKGTHHFIEKNLLIVLYDEVSVESRLAELLLLNKPEVQWATGAINKIENALAPVAAAYNISLTNELLQGNQTYLLRAMGVLQEELSELQSYAHETSEAMRKAYEFLVIPLSLRNLENLDTKPLEIYSRKKEMRESFQAAIDVKREYDDLRNP